MDIRAALLREHSRANAERIAHHIGEDPDRFAELMRCMLKDTVLVGQRASYSMGLVAQATPDLVASYLKDMIATLDLPVHEAVQRNTVRMLQSCELPTKLHGAIAQKMFGILADPTRSIAQRAFAITVVLRLVKLYPELGEELRLWLEDALIHEPGPAIRSRATKALKSLARDPRSR